eukprot:5203584-Pyramimonas_sp.AAC.1
MSERGGRKGACSVYATAGAGMRVGTHRWLGGGGGKAGPWTFCGGVSTDVGRSPTALRATASTWSCCRKASVSSAERNRPHWINPWRHASAPCRKCFTRRGR